MEVELAVVAPVVAVGHHPDGPGPSEVSAAFGNRPLLRGWQSGGDEEFN